jgi:hypothetical protein
VDDDAARGLALGARLVGPGMFDGGLAAAVDALARAAFNAGLAAARLDPPMEDAEAFYCGLIEGLQVSAARCIMSSGSPATGPRSS